MSSENENRFERDQLCLYRKAGQLTGQIVRIVGPTGASVGPGRYARPGERTPPTPPSHFHYDTEPAIPVGAWGQYLRKVEMDFPLQIAAFLDAIAMDQAFINAPDLVREQLFRLTGLDSVADIEAPKHATEPWKLRIDGEVHGEVIETHHRRAIKRLAEILRRSNLAGTKLQDS